MSQNASAALVWLHQRLVPRGPSPTNSWPSGCLQPVHCTLYAPRPSQPGLALPCPRPVALVALPVLCLRAPLPFVNEGRVIRLRVCFVERRAFLPVRGALLSRAASALLLAGMARVCSVWGTAAASVRGAC